MKKLSFFLIFLVLIAAAILLLKARARIHPSAGPVFIQGSPYKGGAGGGYSMGEWKGRIEESR